jgi:hypothetical protein
MKLLHLLHVWIESAWQRFQMALVASGLGSVARLMRRGLRWIGTRCQIADIYYSRQRAGVGRLHRGDFMHPDLPALVIAERELRP